MKRWILARALPGIILYSKGIYKITMASFFIAFREGLEAALIVGILFGYLKRSGRTSLNRAAWLGVIAAIAVSVAMAAVIRAIGAELSGPAEMIFEGVTMLLAACVVTVMVLWMRAHARALKHDIEADLGGALLRGSALGVAFTAFSAVAREGIETALLLSAASISAGGLNTLAVSVAGLAAATVLGVLIYFSVLSLNLRTFFRVTSVLLLVFAAGLLARSVAEFQEAGLLFTLNEHLWDTRFLLDDGSTAGTLFKTLFGYMSQPSLESVAAYVLYIVAAVTGARWFLNTRAPRIGA